MTAAVLRANSGDNVTKQSESTEVQVTKVSAKNEPEKMGVLKVDSPGQAVEKPLTEDLSSEKKVRLLAPTQDQEWTKVELWSYQKLALITLRATLLRPFLEMTIKNFTEKSWKKIEDISLWKMQTLGDVEMAALTIINASDKPMEAKEQTHENIKSLFKVYAEQGYAKLVTMMKSFKKSE